MGSNNRFRKTIDIDKGFIAVIYEELLKTNKKTTKVKSKEYESAAHRKATRMADGGYN